MAVEGGWRGRGEVAVEGGGIGGVAVVAGEVAMEELEAGRWWREGVATRHQSSSPCSRPPKLNNPTSADH